MIPPLLLDMHPGCKVVDMCAAPGSKTLQALERMDESDDGWLVANELNSQRARVLARRLSDAGHSKCCVTSHPAQYLPLLEPDLILCDVPCSGDGTIRKAAEVVQHVFGCKTLHAHIL